MGNESPKSCFRLDAGTFGTMGVGPGFAIAAAMLEKAQQTGRRVLCVEGDSAFGFSGMEVETMCRYLHSTNFKPLFLHTLQVLYNLNIFKTTYIYPHCKFALNIMYICALTNTALCV